MYRRHIFGNKNLEPNTHSGVGQGVQPNDVRSDHGVQVVHDLGGLHDGQHMAHTGHEAQQVSGLQHIGFKGFLDKTIT